MQNFDGEAEAKGEGPACLEVTAKILNTIGTNIMAKEQGQKIKRRVSMRARQLLVLGYKAAGHTDREIVDRIKEDHGVGVSHVTVNSDWHAALLDLTQQMTPKAAELRTLHIVRLEALLQAAWETAISGDLEAIRTCLYIMAQIKNVQGLDKQPVLVYERTESIQIFTEDEEFDWSTVPDSDLKLLVEIVNAARRDPLALGDGSTDPGLDEQPDSA